MEGFMKKRLLVLILPIIALILEILPYGAVLNFGQPNGRIIKETYSYFNLLPFGYANFGPFLTAILTCILIALLVVFCVKGKNSFLKTASVLTGVAIFTSIMPLFFEISSFSIIGLFISLTLCAQLGLMIFSFKKIKN